MNEKKNKIEALKTNGYNLDFEAVFNLTFENYKKIALYAGLIIFVLTIVFVVLFTVGLISYFGVSSFIEMMKPENLTAESMAENGKLYIIIGAIIGACLISPIPAGLIKMAHSAQKDEEFHVSTVFKYYASPYFKELVIATLVIGIFSSATTTAITYLSVPLLDFVFSALTTFVTMLAVPLIIFSDLKAVDAVVSSVILVFKQPLILLGLFVVSYIASLIGIFGCCIGIFFTLPFMYSLYFAVYSQIVGFDETSREDY
jgi:hypothetical protein